MWLAALMRAAAAATRPTRRCTAPSAWCAGPEIGWFRYARSIVWHVPRPVVVLLQAVAVTLLPLHGQSSGWHFPDVATALHACCGPRPACFSRCLCIVRVLTPRDIVPITLFGCLYCRWFTHL